MGTSNQMNQKKYDLRLTFLTPIVSLMVIAMVSTVLLASYLNTYSQNLSLINEKIKETKALAEKIIDNGVDIDSKAIETIIHTLAKDQGLIEIFKSGSRSELQNYSYDIFKSLKDGYDITHFYFHLPNRVNFLRVHAPQRHGDSIDRMTAMISQQTMQISAGVEMGVLGTLTLRVVYPWKDKNGDLLGYLELGKEIDHIVQNLGHITDMPVHLLLHKERLDEIKWEEGMKTLGRENTWALYPDYIESTGHSGHGTQVDIFMDRESLVAGSVENWRHDNKIFRPTVVPIRNLQKDHVADLVLMTDITFPMNAAKNTALIAIVAEIIVGIPILLFFSMQATQLQRKLLEKDLELENLANTDGLTGLWVRRVFDQLVSAEIDRSRRYSHCFSVFMIDIDHFKRFNDKYGHQMGDAALKEVSKCIKGNVRSTDITCRYGGEEMSVILPETDSKTAEDIAHTLNKAVSRLQIALGDEKIEECVTVSIGIATYPDCASSADALLKSADMALYRAKNSGRNCVVSAKYPDLWAQSFGLSGS